MIDGCRLFSIMVERWFMPELGLYNKIHRLKNIQISKGDYSLVYFYLDYLCKTLITINHTACILRGLIISRCFMNHFDFFSFKIIYQIFLILNYFLLCLLSLYDTYFTFKFEAFFRKEKKGNLPYFRPWHQAICIRCINENLTYYKWDTYKMWTVDFIMLFGILLTFCISKCLGIHGTCLICIQVKLCKKREIRKASCISCKLYANKHNFEI